MVQGEAQGMTQYAEGIRCDNQASNQLVITEACSWGLAGGHRQFHFFPFVANVYVY